MKRRIVHAIQLQRYTRGSGQRNGEESLGVRRGKSAAPTHVGLPEVWNGDRLQCRGL